MNKHITTPTLILALLLGGCAQSLTTAEQKPLVSPLPTNSKAPAERYRSNEAPRTQAAKMPRPDYDAMDAEQYGLIRENDFLAVLDNPRSTFSVDVDSASYSNIRRMIHQGRRPPVDAVRIEEMVNYFHYDYPQPRGHQPFSITTEAAACPWNPGNKLVLIGIQGKQVERAKLPPANLVFLIDVSGSMYSRLALVKASLRLLVQQMRPQDRIAIVVYAGAAGMVLPSTGGDQKDRILSKLDALQAGGGTAGGAGINLAYRVAELNRSKGDNSRIILVTDGDFNVGPHSESELYHLIETKRDKGIYLTVLGVGMGNYKDAKVELLADKGNGNYAYLDSLQEARKVLVSQMGGTLLTIARDVKVQVQFNPSRVKSYRLIGYENRLLKNRDFNDDSKDAGEIGAGHSVTALYEIVPQVGNPPFRQNDYVDVHPSGRAASGELMTVRFRYIPPAGGKSQLLSRRLMDSDGDYRSASGNFRFASAVAEYGLLLRNSKYKSGANLRQVMTLAGQAVGDDREGYRQSFIQLVRSSQALLEAGNTLPLRD